MEGAWKLAGEIIVRAKTDSRKEIKQRTWQKRGIKNVRNSFSGNRCFFFNCTRDFLCRGQSVSLSKTTSAESTVNFNFHHLSVIRQHHSLLFLCCCFFSLLNRSSVCFAWCLGRINVGYHQQWEQLRFNLFPPPLLIVSVVSPPEWRQWE